MGRPARPLAIGTRIGRLTIVSEPIRRNDVTAYKCRCDCGRTIEVLRGHLRPADRSSLSRRACRSCANTTHGKTHSREWESWRAMRDRCGSQPEYAGRGIVVCSRWARFEAFLADMGPAPGSGYTVERINNDGNYEPGNCRWASRKTQARNRRSSRTVTVGLECRCVAEWAERSGIEAATIIYRLNAGWDPAAAVTTRPGSKRL